MGLVSLIRVSQVIMVKNPGTCQCRDIGDKGSIPEIGGFTGEGDGKHSSIPAWRILRIEEPGPL